MRIYVHARHIHIHAYTHTCVCMHVYTYSFIQLKCIHKCIYIYICVYSVIYTYSRAVRSYRPLAVQVQCLACGLLADSSSGMSHATDSYGSFQKPGVPDIDPRYNYSVPIIHGQPRKEPPIYRNSHVIGLPAICLGPMLVRLPFVRLDTGYCLPTSPQQDMGLQPRPTFFTRKAGFATNTPWCRGTEHQHPAFQRASFKQYALENSWFLDDLSGAPHGTLQMKGTA